MAKQFEYKQEFMQVTDLYKFSENSVKLNSQGQKGWELCGTAQDGHLLALFYKREVVNE